VSLYLYGHAEERVWHHLDGCQFQTYLQPGRPGCSVPVMGCGRCARCGLNPGARITTLFGRLAVDVLRETGVQGATRILSLTWDEAWEIKRQARRRAHRRHGGPASLGIDETTVARGQRSSDPRV
jgi:transposase